MGVSPQWCLVEMVWISRGFRLPEGKYQGGFPYPHLQEDRVIEVDNIDVLR